MEPVQCIVGSAGHIDHGKTRLVKTLTGVDCDRFEEEKKRGITIDLGFAHMDIEGGRSIGIIDVPGHQRFIHNMLAGATGVDIGLLVIAADDAVMPQTVEHLAILEMVGVKSLVVALTKIDIVDYEIKSLATDDIKRLLISTPFASAKIMPCSSVTGQGVTDLKKEITRLALLTPEKSVESYFRMPVDRVFSIKGHGLVATGTVFSGSIKTGEKLCFSPSGDEGRIRQIHNFGQSAEIAKTGVRTAINIAGVEKSRITRGMVLCDEAISGSHKSFIGKIACHKASPLPIRHGVSYLLYTHTAERLCKVFLMSGQSLAPGEETIAQFRFSEPFNLLNGDRIVLRDSSASHTLGGGAVIFPGGPPLGRRAIRAMESYYRSLESVDSGVLSFIKKRPHGVLLSEIGALFNLVRPKLLAKIKKSGAVATFEWKGKSYACDKKEGVRTVKTIERTLIQFHEDNPALSGAEESWITREVFKNVGDSLSSHWIRRATSSKVIENKGGLLRLPGREATFEGTGGAIKTTILDIYEKAEFSPPKSDQIYKTIGHDKKKVFDVCRTLIDSGELVSLSPGFTLHKKTLDHAKSTTLDEIAASGSINAARLRDLLGNSGRKAAIEILEYFDQLGLTKRIDSKGIRILKKK